MTYTEVIGYAAACLTTYAFIPQVIHTFKIKDTSSISLGMYSILVLGLICWLVYGVLKGDWPMIAANSITLMLAFPIMVYKIYQIRSQK